MSSDSWQIENLKGAITLAGQTIKSLELVNGAAAIALLTFYGNAVARNDTHIPFDKIALLWALKSFGLGVAAAVFCAIFAYLSQLQSAVRPGRIEVAARIIAMLFGLGSAGLFAFGMWCAGASFR